MSQSLQRVKRGNHRDHCVGKTFAHRVGKPEKQRIPGGKNDNVGMGFVLLEYVVQRYRDVDPQVLVR